MAAPQITPLPTPPVRSDAPADFSSKADAFVAALVPFVTETNGSVAFVDQRAIDADASATAAAASEAAVEADRAEVATNTATVASNTATVVARADEVAANTLQVAADTQQVATDAQSVADALASIAGGPVYSVNGMTGAVTGVATQAGAETLTNITVVDPVVALGGSQGVAGQVPVSQGAGLPPVWGEAGALILLATVVANNSATVELTLPTTDYENYLLVASGVTGSASGGILLGKMKVGGAYSLGPWYSVSTAYDSNTSAVSGRNQGSFYISKFNSAAGINFSLEAFGTTDSISKKFVSWRGGHKSGPDLASTYTGLLNIFGSASEDASTGPLTGLQFFFSTGSIAAGEFRLYGIKQG